MSSRRLVKLLTTGGTIATRRGADGVTRPEVDGENIRRLLAERASPEDVDLEVEELSLRPSWSLGPSDMDAIARATVRAACDGRCTGVVVTHGTTTLEYSAFLTDLRHPGQVPIVFTGAMRPADAPEPDGPANLADALAVATNASAAGRGALVVLAGRILSAREAWKGHRNDVDAFIGLNGGLGHVSAKDGIVEIAGQTLRSRAFHGDLDQRVALVKAYPGAGEELVKAAIHAGNRGLVVEGLPGAGGLPVGMQAGIRGAVSEGCSVVLASRALFGRVPERPSGGTGEPLADIGLISAGDLTAEKAWVLLMVALAETSSPEQVGQVFHEVTGRPSAQASAVTANVRPEAGW